MTSVLIIGATSAIAKAVAKVYADKHCHLYLCGRDLAQTSIIAKDLELRGASVKGVSSFEATSFSTHSAMLQTARESLGQIDIAFIAHGTLPNQETCEDSFSYTLDEINVNAISVISLLTELTPLMRQTDGGTIAVVTSVAGDRGRQSNYTYGASKSMVSTYIQGLRNRLYDQNIHIVDIKPGFIDSPMTADFEQNFLWSKPNEIAPAIISGIERRSNCIYTPWYWRIIMFAIRSIPEAIFKKMKL